MRPSCDREGVAALGEGRRSTEAADVARSACRGFPASSGEVVNAPGKIRTCDLSLRRKPIGRRAHANSPAARRKRKVCAGATEPAPSSTRHDTGGTLSSGWDQPTPGLLRGRQS
jgi:hypothetical protein